MKLKIDLNLSMNERVSSVLAILLVMVLSILVAILTLKSANNIRAAAPNLSGFSLDKQMQNLDAKTGL